jgi:hypothetical protein
MYIVEIAEGVALKAELEDGHPHLLWVVDIE